MFILMEYARSPQNKHQVLGQISVRGALEDKGGEAVRLDNAPFDQMIRSLVQLVNDVPDAQVYFRRLENPDSLPAPMLGSDVELMRTNPEQAIERLCNPAPVVLDLRKKEKTR